MKVPPVQSEPVRERGAIPELVKPADGFDTRGRLWVAAWRTIPSAGRKAQGLSSLVFEDTNGDGQADNCTTFIDGLNCPTGFSFTRTGDLVQAPDVCSFRDTDGDGKADWRERILDGMDSADSHHTATAGFWTPLARFILATGCLSSHSSGNAMGSAGAQY